MKNNRLIAYALDAASFIIEKVGTAHIKQIILFGSVARGTETKESDVDIFIDTDKNIEETVKKTLASFYESRKYTMYWKLLGITHDINPMVGDLDQWALKRSIISEGIVLYGLYHGKITGKTYTLFFISVPKKRSQQVKHWRALYGYTQKVGKKRYASPGIVSHLQGKKVSPGVIMVPSHAAAELMRYLHKHRIKYRLIELSTDASL